MQDNPFHIGDVVHYPHHTEHKAHGIVKAIACYAATAKGGRSCDKCTCDHPSKNFVWVEWPSKETFVYTHNELMFSQICEANKIFERKIEADKEVFNFEQYNGTAKDNTLKEIIDG